MNVVVGHDLARPCDTPRDCERSDGADLRSDDGDDNEDVEGDESDEGHAFAYR